MHRTSNGLVVAIAGMALLWTAAVGGCADSPPGSEEAELESEAGPPATVDDGEGPFAEPRIVVLEPAGDDAGQDAVRGRATLTRVDESIEMALQLQGLGEEGTYRAELAEGPCPADAAATDDDSADVILSLDVTGGEGPAAEGPVTRNASDIPPGTRLHVRVLGPDGRLLACGALDD